MALTTYRRQMSEIRRIRNYKNSKTFKDPFVALAQFRKKAVVKLEIFWNWFLGIVIFFNPYYLWTSKDLWDKVHLWFCYIKTRLTANSREKARLLEWVQSKVTTIRPPRDFSSDWKDGIVLCALVEAIMPGTCPRYDLLNPDHSLSNIKLGLGLIEQHTGIKTSVTAEDVYKCTPGIEKRLICLVSQLRLVSMKMKMKTALRRPVIKVDQEVSFGGEQECFAKGMGLILAVKGRKARFNIFFHSMSNMNIVIEIRGPKNSVCSERITNRSPKKKLPALTTPAIAIPDSSGVPADIEKLKIPFEYEIHAGKIAVSYIPVVNGKHKLSIIWQGQHIMGSPYTINVDDSMDGTPALEKLSTQVVKKFLVPPGKRINSSNISVTKARSALPPSNAFGRSIANIRSGNNNASIKKLGNVLRRTVLQHILVVDGEEIVVKSTESCTLAEALKKHLSLKNKVEEESEGKTNHKKVLHRQVSMCANKEQMPNEGESKEDCQQDALKSDTRKCEESDQKGVSSNDSECSSSSSKTDSCKLIDLINHCKENAIKKEKITKSPSVYFDAHSELPSGNRGTESVVQTDESFIHLSKEDKIQQTELSLMGTGDEKADSTETIKNCTDKPRNPELSPKISNNSLKLQDGTEIVHVSKTSESEHSTSNVCEPDNRSKIADDLIIVSSSKSTPLVVPGSNSPKCSENLSLKDSLQNPTRESENGNNSLQISLKAPEPVEITNDRVILDYEAAKNDYSTVDVNTESPTSPLLHDSIFIENMINLESEVSSLNPKWPNIEKNDNYHNDKGNFQTNRPSADNISPKTSLSNETGMLLDDSDQSYQEYSTEADRDESQVLQNIMVKATNDFLKEPLALSNENSFESVQQSEFHKAHYLGKLADSPETVQQTTDIKDPKETKTDIIASSDVSVSIVPNKNSTDEPCIIKMTHQPSNACQIEEKIGETVAPDISNAEQNEKSEEEEIIITPPVVDNINPERALTSPIKLSNQDKSDLIDNDNLNTLISFDDEETDQKEKNSGEEKQVIMDDVSYFIRNETEKPFCNSTGVEILNDLLINNRDVFDDYAVKETMEEFLGNSGQQEIFEIQLSSISSTEQPSTNHLKRTCTEITEDIDHEHQKDSLLLQDDFYNNNEEALQTIINKDVYIEEQTIFPSPCKISNAVQSTEGVAELQSSQTNPNQDDAAEKDSSDMGISESQLSSDATKSKSLSTVQSKKLFWEEKLKTMKEQNPTKPISHAESFASSVPEELSSVRQRKQFWETLSTIKQNETPSHSHCPPKEPLARKIHRRSSSRSPSREVNWFADSEDGQDSQISKDQVEVAAAENHRSQVNVENSIAKDSTQDRADIQNKLLGIQIPPNEIWDEIDGMSQVVNISSKRCSYENSSSTRNSSIEASGTPNSEFTEDSGLVTSVPSRNDTPLKNKTCSFSDEVPQKRSRSYSDPTGERQSQHGCCKNNLCPFRQPWSNFKSWETLALKVNPFISMLDVNSSQISSTETEQATDTETDKGFIDDEIPDYASLFLGNYVSFTGLLNTEKPFSRRELLEYDFIDSENWESNTDPQNGDADSSINNETDDQVPCPEKCQAFGVGVYYGQVGVKNHFQVRTRDAGRSSLTVGMQGPEQQDVIEVTVTYIGNYMYEVMYEVAEPGYYVINVKWGDWSIPDSPFICKVTY